MNNKSAVRRISGGGFSTAKTLFIFPLSLLLVFFFLPVLSIFRHISLESLSETLSNAYYRRIIVFTFIQAAVSTLSALIAGLPGAWLMSRLDFRGKKFVTSLTTVPFVLPSVLVVLGFVLCFGNSGIVNSLLMKLSGSGDPPASDPLLVQGDNPRAYLLQFPDKPQADIGRMEPERQEQDRGGRDSRRRAPSDIPDDNPAGPSAVDNCGGVAHFHLLLHELRDNPGARRRPLPSPLSR